MQARDALKIIDDGWIRRRKGFRVCFQRRADSEWITDYFPSEKEKPLPSDVATWELARRFAAATKAGIPGANEGEMVNIYVVDDLGEAVRFYGTNQFKTFNRRDMEEVARSGD
jgi:hypothetical protein